MYLSKLRLYAAANLIGSRAQADRGTPASSRTSGQVLAQCGELNLITSDLQPGHLVGPYLLQEHVTFLGRHTVHAADYAFHPPMIQQVGMAEAVHGLLPPIENSRTRPDPTTDEGIVLAGKSQQGQEDTYYWLRGRFDQGSHGEVWRGQRLGHDGHALSSPTYILKRMFLEKGEHVRLAGGREVYFGEIIKDAGGHPNIARYLEHFYHYATVPQDASGAAPSEAPADVQSDSGQEPKNSGDADEAGWDGGSGPNEMWLVFHDEGLSLRHYLYTERKGRGYVVHGQSDFWRSMRLDDGGAEMMRDLVHQLLVGASALQAMGVVHRDIKPSNLLLSRSEPDCDGGSQAGEECSAGKAPGGPRKEGSFWRVPRHHAGRRSSEQRWLILKIADFSSAVDETALNGLLYGDTGPTRNESTLSYAPPEVLFNNDTPYAQSRPESYDAWSIGVVILEMLLGTPDVFTVDQRTRAMLDRELSHATEAERVKAFLLAAMADLCIYSPSSEAHIGGTEGAPNHRFPHGKRPHWPLGNTAVVMDTCTLADLGKALHARDPLDRGLQDQWGLDLLWRLLRWDPDERIPLQEALTHAYFMGPYVSKVDGSEHATAREMAAYDMYMRAGKGAFPLPLVQPWHDLSAEAAPPAATPHAMHPHRLLQQDWARLAHRLNSHYHMHRGHREHHSAPVWPQKSESSALNKRVVPVEPEEQRHRPKLDMQHTLNLDFTCPKCGRTFNSWTGCHSHLRARRSHGSFCLYDTAHLPPCISSHSMLPYDPHSGWCDVQGRRSKIEDYHSIVFTEQYKFYGVFDGHCGTKAAKFTSRALHMYIELFLGEQQTTPPTDIETGTHLAQASRVTGAVQQAFRQTNEDFASIASTQDDASGTTATIALVFKDLLVVANVGDSRAVLCCGAHGQAIEVTTDHTPYHAAERARVEAAGGEIEMRGVLRVNGQLAVTRSIGNWPLSSRGVLSAEPDVHVFHLHEATRRSNDDVCQTRPPHTETANVCWGHQETQRSASGRHNDTPVDYQFIILASDGVWDVVSSKEAVTLVQEVIQGVSVGHQPDVFRHSSAGSDGQNNETADVRYGHYSADEALQMAATALTHEAYVRESTDNIGVCVVSLVAQQPVFNETSAEQP